ncbi:unnamed protein product, partial [Ectocarpus sp. 12 AP-2014]
AAFPWCRGWRRPTSRQPWFSARRPPKRPSKGPPRVSPASIGFLASDHSFACLCWSGACRYPRRLDYDPLSPTVKVRRSAHTAVATPGFYFSLCLAGIQGIMRSCCLC